MSDVHVIGAGIAGLMSAWELSRAGMRVTVLERGMPGRESSWAGGGILSPLYPWRYPDPVNALSRWSQQVYSDLCQQLLQDTGIDPEYQQSGLLILDEPDLAAARQWSVRFDTPLTTLTHGEVRQWEPSLADACISEQALALPDAGQVRNPQLLQSLLAALDARGVRVQSNAEVVGFEVDQRVRQLHLADGKHMDVEQVVVCSGAWSGGLMQALQLPALIEPVRGQMLLIRARPGVVTRILLDQGRYVIPRRDGRILVGSTMERVGFDKSTSPAVQNELWQYLIAHYPELSAYPIEKHWSGLRPGSPQGVPVIAPHPQVEGLYFNTGHFRNGVVMAPASARLLANHVTGNVPILPPEDYNPFARDIKNTN